MKKISICCFQVIRCFFSLFLYILLLNTNAQEVGVINDPDGFTNLREGPSTKSQVIAKVLEGEHFLFFPTDTTNWWRVNFAENWKTSFQGYMHRSRIQAAFAYDPSHKKIYHEYMATASSFRTTKRNIDPESLPDYYFIETVNHEGQVVDLRFMVNGKIKSNTLCYLSAWIKFEYPNKRTIITYNLNSDGRKQSSAECDMWYRTTYALNDSQKQILYADIDYALDSATLLAQGWEEDELALALQNVKPARIYPSTINGYMKSTAMLNGLFPIGKDLNLEQYSYMGLEFEELKEQVQKQRIDN